MSIRQALAENLISLYQFYDHITLVNLRLLPIKMVEYRGELWLESGEARINVADLKEFTNEVV